MFIITEWAAYVLQYCYVDSTLSLMDLYVHSTVTRLKTMLYSAYIKILNP